MADPLLARAADLERRGEPYVLATVVRCQAPTSAKPGAKALVRADGRVEGWVGGACAEPVVVREALSALRDRGSSVSMARASASRGAPRASSTTR